MLKSSFFKNKKSAIDLALKELLEITLAIIIILLLIYFGLKLSGIIFGRQEYDSAVNNMEALAVRITDLIKDKKDSGTQTMAFSIPDDFILVGFDYDDKGTMKTECTSENIMKSRPKICQGKSCLCIFNNYGGIANPTGKDFDDRGNVVPVKCRDFDEKIVFLAQPPSANFLGAKSGWNINSQRYPSYHSLVTYGICGGPWGTSFGIRQINIEKYKENDNQFILINEIIKK